MTIAAVAQNINAFRNHLQAEDFHMMENENNDGSIFFSTDQRTDSGANIRLVVAFSNDYTSVDMYCLNIAQVNNPLKKDAILTLLNDLNTDYRFAKFTIENSNSITISIPLDFSETNFDPSVVMKHLFGLYNCADKEYQTFMKLIWA
ncbi:TPA: hypothetical protein ACOQ31_003929 [Bacillus cereus]|uniref:hypothetical protein n=1 Tax=Bacillus cereus group TaxID=86661 RepID=UPI000BEA229B|nr:MULTISPECIES: hypothetical protein [Bacillus cereus group]MBL3764076.1 hypothetical protein [Bacillus cereus]MBL3772637.1 hypothetical protein [Bacillus cereus]MBL3775761.1 hypothetical protein [Bacillus cereus]MBL3786866.1 hypothetical protein [Bacillus cereus]MBY5227447.1 hypothetical protein [Bacillus paranthracis]